MRSFVATAVATTMLAGLLLAGGCVAKEKYDKAVAMMRNANEQLENSQQALRDAREDNSELQEQLGDCDAALQSKSDEVALLEKSKDELSAEFAKLQALYEKLSQGDKPVDLPPFPLPAKVDQALKAFAAANPGLLDYLPQYGMVKLKSDLTFAVGSHMVRPAAQDALKKLVAIVNSPEASSFNVYVAGHTDDIPIVKETTKRMHPNNWYLSVHRAVAVEQVLTTAGLKPERIGAMGFGEYHPVAPNAAGHKGNRLNRRVEIWLVPPDRFLTAGGPAVPESPSK